MGQQHGLRTWVMRRWAQLACVCMGIRVRTQGAAPAGSYLLVSNHLGYTDIPVIASQTGCRFVSKSEVRHWPVVGPLARLAGTVFVNRARRRDVLRVGGEIGAAVAEGSGVVFFPEGTSTRGERVEHFRSSLLQPAAEADLPVHFATLRYETPEGEQAADMSVAWWGDMTLGPHLLHLMRMPRIDALLIFGKEPLRHSDRKLLAEGLQTAVAERFVSMSATGAEAS
jgi:1-acyl-sn-glycerol-3-phosphate acyltransferase